MAEPFDEGYPPSSEADLDPGPDLTGSLDDADRDAGEEHRFTPEGHRPDGSIEDEEREDAGEADYAAVDAVDDADEVDHDSDDMDSLHQLAAGRA